ncbi:unnamed protein product [Gongylonema pulchrum]|uniref:DUF5641 domain-containing protein n=1 Tax=Gongylonema pulchrum TaxID=637853 RepID=A0A183EKS9_9BILA|nr:unnamed protein product [Gongylonema pulchrum]
MVQKYQKNKWVHGVIKRRIGRVIHEVQVGKEILRKHANQLRKRITPIRCKQCPDQIDSDTLQTMLESLTSKNLDNEMQRQQQIHCVGDRQDCAADARIDISPQQQPRQRLEERELEGRTDRVDCGTPVSTNRRITDSELHNYQY